jgi:hypothetical protein
MALNIQGGIYIGLAYGDVPFLDITNLLSTLASLEDTCSGGDPILPFGGLRTTARKSQRANGTAASGSPFTDMLGKMFEVAEPILTKTPPEQSKLKGKFANPARVGKAQSAVDAKPAYIEHEKQKLYGGLALIISGACARTAPVMPPSNSVVMLNPGMCAALLQVSAWWLGLPIMMWRFSPNFCLCSNKLLPGGSLLQVPSVSPPSTPARSLRQVSGAAC